MGTQDWFWTDEWQEQERQADEDIEKGRVKVFASIDDAIEYLEGVEDASE